MIRTLGFFRVAALVIAPAVFAQSTAPDVKREVVALDELVVKADRVTDQTLGKIPMSIEVRDASWLNQYNATDLLGSASHFTNVTFASAFNAVEISIRGITSTNNTEVGDPAAGLSIDEIAFPRPESASAALFDLETVQVLLGPQGTLYGRNTIAGAVNIVTRKPESRTYTTARASAENRNGKSLELVSNLPVSRTLAIRAAWFGKQKDGWIPVEQSVANPRAAGWLNQQAGRLHLAWTPVESTSVLVSVNGHHDKGSSSVFLLRAPDGTPQRLLPTDLENDKRSRGAGVRWELTHDFDPVKMSYTGARQKEDIEMSMVYLLSPLPSPFFVGAENDTNQAFQSHELRFSDTSESPLNWVAGAFWHEERNRVLQAVPLFNLAFWQPRVRSQSKAVYGQVTRRLTNQSRVFAGLRRTEDQKSRQGGQYSLRADGSIGDLYVENDADRTWRSWDFRTGAEVDLTSSTLLYATAASGFKSGGFFDGTGDVYYRPEKLHSLEAGSKAMFWGDRLTFDLSAFLYRYRDFQVSSIETNETTGLIGTVTRNIGSVPLRGFESKLGYRLTSHQRLEAGIGHLEGRFRDFVIGGTDVQGQVINRDLSGNRPAKAPRWSWKFGYVLDKPLSQKTRLGARIDLHGTDGYFISYDNHPLSPHPRDTWQKPFTLADCAISVSSNDQAWSFGLFVKNLQDRAVMTGAHGIVSGDIAAVIEPRTFGLQGQYLF